MKKKILAIGCRKHHPWRKATHAEPNCSSLTLTFSKSIPKELVVPVESMITANTLCEALF